MTKAMMDDPRRIKEENPFESMMERFDRAAKLLNLNPDLYAVMRVPNRELKVYIPVRMDSGRLEIFEGYRVQHNFARGPAKGGIRYAPDVTHRRGARARRVDDLEVRGRQRPIRRREGRRHLRPGADVPRRARAITRRYAAELIDFIGPEKDVPAPDMNTNEQTMAWIMDTYSMHARHTVNAVVTGKPVELGGSRGRREATGRGLLFVVNEAIKRFKLSPPNTRVVVQGSGNVGGIGARLLHEAGYKVVAISDIFGGIHNPNGIDIPAALAHLQQTRSLAGVSRCRAGLEQGTARNRLRRARALRDRKPDNLRERRPD